MFACGAHARSDKRALGRLEPTGRRPCSSQEGKHRDRAGAMANKDYYRQHADTCLFLSECADPAMAEHLVELAQQFVARGEREKRERHATRQREN
jgi:hypothetical protein